MIHKGSSSNRSNLRQQGIPLANSRDAPARNHADDTESPEQTRRTAERSRIHSRAARRRFPTPPQQAPRGSGQHSAAVRYRRTRAGHRSGHPQRRRATETSVRSAFRSLAERHIDHELRHRGQPDPAGSDRRLRAADRSRAQAPPGKPDRPAGAHTPASQLTRECVVNPHGREISRPFAFILARFSDQPF